MKCLYCGSGLSVTNSRINKRLNLVWRRRRCRGCGALFTSKEMIDLSQAVLVQKGPKHAEPFSRDKLLLSIHSSLKHRKTAQKDAAALTDTVIYQLRPHLAKATISKDIIREIVATTLARFDKAASTHYTAFHLD